MDHPTPPGATPAGQHRFRPGRTVQRREVLHGRLWMSHPVTVVDDTDGVLAVLVRTGSGVHLPRPPVRTAPLVRVHPLVRHHRAAAAPRPRPLPRLEDVPRRVFDHWYLNLEAPILRHPDPTGGGSFDTEDHGLDIVVPADGSPWQYQDLHDPEQMAATGRITPVEAAQIHTDGAALAQLLTTDTRWWSPWDTWNPGDPPPTTR